MEDQSLASLTLTSSLEEKGWMGEKEGNNRKRRGGAHQRREPMYVGTGRGKRCADEEKRGEKRKRRGEGEEKAAEERRGLQGAAVPRFGCH